MDSQRDSGTPSAREISSCDAMQAGTVGAGSYNDRAVWSVSCGGYAPRFFLLLSIIMRPVLPFGRIVVACALSLCASAGRAQSITDVVRDADLLSRTEPVTVTREGRARFFDPADGQLDLSYYLETAQASCRSP